MFVFIKTQTFAFKNEKTFVFLVFCRCFMWYIINEFLKIGVSILVVSIVMGSSSDWPTMKKAKDMLDYFEIETDVEVVSAHRTPKNMYEFATNAKEKGTKVIIAGAGGAAHLPGMIASMTNVPVIGVPIQTKALSGIDSLYSIVQMPGGVPVATMAIGEAGATNAGIYAAKMIAIEDESVYDKLEAYTKSLEKKVEDMQNDLK